MPDTPAPTTAPAPRGRPVDPRKDEQILCAAARLFMHQGLQGTTMEQIAKDANVSKLTLYRRYPDKNTLFTDVVVAKCESYLPDEILTPQPGPSAQETLQRLGEALLRLLTSEAGLDLHRVITAETAHNPELGGAFYARGPEPFQQAMKALLDGLNARGDLKIDDTSAAAEHFVALLVGSRLCERCRLRLRGAPDEAEIAACVGRIVGFFMRGCGGA